MHNKPFGTNMRILNQLFLPHLPPKGISSNIPTTLIFLCSKMVHFSVFNLFASLFSHVFLFIIACFRIIYMHVYNTYCRFELFVYDKPSQKYGHVLEATAKKNDYVKLIIRNKIRNLYFNLSSFLN